MFIKRWMDKLIMVYPYHWIFCINKKEQILTLGKTWVNLENLGWAKEAKRRVLCISSIWNRLTSTDGKQRDCLEMEKGKMTAKWHKGTLGDDENVLLSVLTRVELHKHLHLTDLIEMCPYNASSLCHVNYSLNKGSEWFSRWQGHCIMGCCHMALLLLDHFFSPHVAHKSRQR